MIAGEGRNQDEDDLRGGLVDARNELGAVADQVERRVNELGSAIAPPDKEHAGQLVVDARQSLLEEVPLDRLWSLTSELRQVLQGLSTTAATGQQPSGGGEERTDDDIDTGFTTPE